MKFIGFNLAIIALMVFFAGCGGKPQQQDRQLRTIVFFGDSLTWGFGVDRESESYVSRIARVMQAGVYENVRTVNAGRNGDTTRDALARLESDVIAFEPDIVIIEFGLNDCQAGAITPSVYRSNIAAMIERIPAGTEIILATSPSFLTGGGPEWERLNNSLDTYMEVLRQLGRERSLTIIDVQRAWDTQIRYDSRNMERMYLDPSHPSVRGHDFIYNLYMNVLRRKLAG